MLPHTLDSLNAAWHCVALRTKHSTAWLDTAQQIDWLSQLVFMLEMLNLWLGNYVTFASTAWQTTSTSNSVCARQQAVHHPATLHRVASRCRACLCFRRQRLQAILLRALSPSPQATCGFQQKQSYGCWKLPYSCCSPCCLCHSPKHQVSL